MKDTNEEIEFYVPELGLDLDKYLNFDTNSLTTNKEKRLIKQGVHHLGRYCWAQKVLTGKRNLNVLDVACGAGYGTYILSESLPSLNFYGGDYDSRAISSSLKNYGISSNRKYIQFDLETWKSTSIEKIPLFDIIISFDTIEHVNHRDIVLMNIAENLASDGFVLLSTPIHKEDILRPGWEHHKIEYGVKSFSNILKRYFSTIVDPKNPNFPEKDFWSDYINANEIKYLNRFNPLVCKDQIKIE